MNKENREKKEGRKKENWRKKKNILYGRYTW